MKSVAAGVLGGFLLLSMFLVGCGPELSKRDLGTVVGNIPKVSGADKPYPMPQLGPAPKEDEESQRRH